MATKNYTKDDLTVQWRSDLCIHSAICVNGLKKVFNPKSRPWINLDGADLDSIRKQVHKCPSGAISLAFDDDKKSEDPSAIVKVLTNGPLQVIGDIMIINSDEVEISKKTKTLLCRCGASENKPFCDGHHRKIGFKG